MTLGIRSQFDGRAGLRQAKGGVSQFECQVQSRYGAFGERGSNRWSPRVPQEDMGPNTATAIDTPVLADGADMWKMAVECGLDLNSAYKYLIFCRDFADTSAIARVDGRPAGFVTGYLRPGTDTLFVWQIGVLEAFRGRRLGLAMLDELCHRRRERPAYLEATVTPGNEASQRLFRSFAESQGVPCVESPCLSSDLFPEPHEPEMLFRIGPMRSAPLTVPVAANTEGDD